MATKEDQKKIDQYTMRLAQQVSDIFKDESDNHIDFKELKEGDNMTLFFHALTNVVPAFVWNKFSDAPTDILGMNHNANRMIFQYAKPDHEQE